MHRGSRSVAADRLKALFEARAAAVRVRPEAGRGCERARVRLAYGLACDVEHDDRSMRVDLPAEDGGGATGPHPAQLMRASLGASLLIGYRIWGARLDVAIAQASVDIRCEYDVRGELGVDLGVPAGWTRVCFDVTVESDAPEHDVQRVIDAAHRHSPMLALLSPAVARELRVYVRAVSR